MSIPTVGVDFHRPARVVDESEDCNICYSHTDPKGSRKFSVEDGNPTHFFHESCITAWAIKSDTCPICRRKINSINGKMVDYVPATTMEQLASSIMIFAAVFFVGGLLLALKGIMSGLLVSLFMMTVFFGASAFQKAPQIPRG